MALTRADAARIARNRIRITPGAQLDPAAVDKTGSTVNIFVNAVAALAEECEARSEGRFAAQLVAGAEGEDLDRLILERSKGKLPRKGAAAASIDLQVSRTSTAAGEGVVEAGTEVLAGGLTWTLDAPVVFTATALSGGAVTATCATLGSVGNGVKADVQKFKAPSSLFDATLVVEAQGSADPGAGIASAGGDERETDEAYRARYALWDAGLDRNLDFLAAGALGVPGVANAVALEDIDGEGNPTGSATVYLGDAFGRAGSGLLQRVRAQLRGFRLLGQHVSLAQTIPEFVSVTLLFGVLEGNSIDQVREEARAAVVAVINALPPGATLTRALLSTALASVPGLALLEGTPFGFTVPAADLVPAQPSTIFRTRTDLVSFG